MTPFNRTAALCLVGLLVLSACDDKTYSASGTATASVSNKTSDAATSSNDAASTPDTQTPDDVGTTDSDDTPDDTVVPDIDAATCALLVHLLLSDETCQDGTCFEVSVDRGGFLYINDDTPNASLDGMLQDAEFDSILTRVEQLDLLALEDCYGTDCEEHQGAGSTLTFFNPEGTEAIKTVYTQEIEALPEPLGELSTRLQGLWNDRNSWVSLFPASCIRTILFSDERRGNTNAVCENIPSEIHRTITWSLSGPNNQYIIGSDVALDGIDSADLPLTWTFDGQIAETDPAERQRLGPFEIETSDGARWRLRFDNYPDTLPAFCLTIGQQIRITAYVGLGFEHAVLGLMIEDPDRGLIFMTDQGISGLHDLDSSPLKIDVARSDCPGRNACEFDRTDTLRFSNSIKEIELLPARWGVLPTEEGYDILAINLRSFGSDLCSDYWDYAYAAFGLSGTDQKQCTTP